MSDASSSQRRPWIPSQSREKGMEICTIIIPILQMWKLSGKR